MSRRNRVKESIDKLFESEIRGTPRFANMKEGQLEEFRGGFLDFAIVKLGAEFVQSENVAEQLMILKVLLDYSGNKPKVEHSVLSVENPYEGMTELEMDIEERRLLGEPIGTTSETEEAEGTEV